MAVQIYSELSMAWMILMDFEASIGSPVGHGGVLFCAPKRGPLHRPFAAIRIPDAATPGAPLKIRNIN